VSEATDVDVIARPWWRAVPQFLPLALICGYALVLLTRVNEPGRIIFDETYYVDDARSFLALGGVEGSFAVHPPVGKWLIAASIRIFGDNTVGWRFGGVVAGIAIATFVWLIARRLFSSRWAANLALFLVITDGLLLVQARTSMLDIHLAVFVIAAAWLLVRDLDATAPTAGMPAPAWRVTPWRWATGLALGLAIATKWSGLLALGAAGLIVLATEVRRWRDARRQTGDHHTNVIPSDEAPTDEAPTDEAETDEAPADEAETDEAETDEVRTRGPGLVRRLALGIAVPLVLLPAGTYLLTYVPWLVNYQYTTEGHDDCPDAAELDVACDVGVVGRLRGLWHEHVDIARFHRDLESDHPYRAQPWTWPVMGRPISYYYETCADFPSPADDPCEVPPGTAAEVLALGNPALWWGFLGLLPLVTAGMRRGERSSWLPGAFYLAQVAPWMAISRPAFFFYMVPAVPFMALGAAAAVERLRVSSSDRTPWSGAASWATVAGLVAGLATREPVAALVGLGAGWVLGPLAADTWLTRRPGAASRANAAAANQPAPAVGDTAPRVPWAAITATVLLVALAGALFVHFWPIWTGIPMDPDDLRLRWWFPSWV